MLCFSYVRTARHKSEHNPQTRPPRSSNAVSQVSERIFQLFLHFPPFIFSFSFPPFVFLYIYICGYHYSALHMTSAIKSVSQSCDIDILNKLTSSRFLEKSNDAAEMRKKEIVGKFLKKTKMKDLRSSFLGEIVSGKGRLLLQEERKKKDEHTRIL